MSALLTLVLVLTPQMPPDAAPPAQTGDDERRSAERRTLAALERTGRFLAERFADAGGWQEQQASLVASVERIYARNGWTSEPDAFSLDVVREISAIPPWQMPERLDALTGRLADRYLLSADQTDALRRLIGREAHTMLVRHGARLIPQIVEAVQTRLAGQPFTAEQIARWTRESTPIFEDMQQRLDSATDEFVQMLDPVQQELAQVDLTAAHRRIERITEMRASWQRGEWQAGDWGLDQDPIQRGDTPNDGEAGAGVSGRHEADLPRDERRRVRPPAPSGAEAAASATTTSRPTSRPASDADSWAQYVRDFIRRYQLDRGQQERAWAIYTSERERRDLFDKRYAEKLASYRRSTSRDTEEFRRGLAEIEQSQASTREKIFESLKRRLDRLPTRAQRRAAAASGPERATDTAPASVSSGP